jgi:hypothetical protein
MTDLVQELVLVELDWGMGGEAQRDLLDAEKKGCAGKSEGE